MIYNPREPRRIPLHLPVGLDGKPANPVPKQYSTAEYVKKMFEREDRPKEQSQNGLDS